MRPFTDVVECISCEKTRRVNLSHYTSKENYIDKYPRCHSCATKHGMRGWMQDDNRCEKLSIAYTMSYDADTHHPDTVIASFVGIKWHTIIMWRKKHGWPKKPRPRFISLRRGAYGPGKLVNSNGCIVIYWPEHPLARHGMLPIWKMEAWQRVGYDIEATLKRINSTRGGGNVDIFMGGPGKPVKRDKGYISYLWHGHPLGFKSCDKVLEHRVVYWQSSGYSSEVLELLNNGATVHHINGKKADNRPENLELRLKGKHPTGIGESDMVKTLTSLGYTIQEPLWKIN